MGKAHSLDLTCLRTLENVTSYVCVFLLVSPVSCHIWPQPHSTRSSFPCSVFSSLSDDTQGLFPAAGAHRRKVKVRSQDSLGCSQGCQASVTAGDAFSGDWGENLADTGTQFVT